jgi:hypothetical protein
LKSQAHREQRCLPGTYVHPSFTLRCASRPQLTLPPQRQLFRYLGDISHLFSKLILILAIHRNRSAEGVSLITQALYAAVFCTRYIDLFDPDKPHPAWNVIFKTFYLFSSFYILGAMQWMFPRSREREFAWKLGAIVLGGSLLLSPFSMLTMVKKDSWGFVRVC